MDDVMLRADCAQCEGLCCVALAFDRSELFAFDKPAGVACRHLEGCNTCMIHDDLPAQGFGGCARYDCLGAGQRVTRMFAGRSWRDGPETARAMFDAFHTMRRVHELVLLLREAGKLPMSMEQEGERVRLLSGLAAGRQSSQSFRALDSRAASEGVMAFLAGLRECVGAPRK